MKRLSFSILLVLISTFAIKAQESKIPPPLPVIDETRGIACVLHNLAIMRVWVKSDKKGFIRDLDYNNFEIFDEKERKEIEFFSFDEQTNEYIIGFEREIFSLDNKRREVKTGVKLSAKEKSEFGKTSVSGQTGYYPNQG